MNCLSNGCTKEVKEGRKRCIYHLSLNNINNNIQLARKQHNWEALAKYQRSAEVLKYTRKRMEKQIILRSSNPDTTVVLPSIEFLWLESFERPLFTGNGKRKQPDTPATATPPPPQDREERIEKNLELIKNIQNELARLALLYRAPTLTTSEELEILRIETKFNL